MQHLGRQRVGPLRYSGPPRPVPLPERPPQGKLRTDSTYDWREIGEQVTRLLWRCFLRQRRKRSAGALKRGLISSPIREALASGVFHGKRRTLTIAIAKRDAVIVA